MLIKADFVVSYRKKVNQTVCTDRTGFLTADNYQESHTGHQYPLEAAGTDPCGEPHCMVMASFTLRLVWSASCFPLVFGLQQHSK